MNEWSHLPNAAHIDQILADLKADPGRWNTAYSVAYAAAWTVAYDAARSAARDAAYSVAYDAAWSAARDAANNAAWGAILALIAYDDCAYLLNEKSEDVHMFALLGQPAAILLYPACLALSIIKEKEFV